MLTCQHCQTSLNRLEDEEFIVRCRNCHWVNKFRFGICKEEEKIIRDSTDDLKVFKKKFGNGILYTYPFDLRYVNHLIKNSQKSGEALKKYMLEGKEKLSIQEKNILYKLKAQSISKIEEKIGYLDAKKIGIKILRLLEF